MQIILWIAKRLNKLARSDNYVLVIASLVPMVSPLMARAPFKPLGYHPKPVKDDGTVIGQIASMLLVGNSHPAFFFRSDFAKVWTKEAENGSEEYAGYD